LEKLSRYETHLDRKFERSLGMLIKLKELRGDAQLKSYQQGRKPEVFS
jgi:hypothetical protein